MTSIARETYTSFSAFPSAFVTPRRSSNRWNPRENDDDVLSSPRRSFEPLHKLLSPMFSSTSLSSIHQDEDGNCIFGQKSYWDGMYQEGSIDDRPAESYSWYCGWDELAPFWNMLLDSDDDRSSTRVLIAGIGNDPAPVHMYDDGWTNMTAFDYSTAAVERAQALFGTERSSVHLLTADATNLPLEEASVDATLDKGTLDAIEIGSPAMFRQSVRELTRVTAPHGTVVTVSRVLMPEELLEAFDNPYWENIHNGELAFAPDGEATIDLGAELFSWRRTSIKYVEENPA